MTARPAVEPWKLELAQRLILGTTNAAIQATPEGEHQALVEALDDLESFADLHGGMTGSTFFGTLMGLATVACKVAPADTFGPDDGPMGLVVEDTVTGRPVADPDTDIADGTDPATAAQGRGALAAMRFFTAAANDDPDTAHALYAGVLDSDANGPFLGTLMRYCGGLLADWMHREGKFTPDSDAAWVARRAAEEAAAPEPAPRAVRHDTATGLDYVQVPVDPRDQHPDDRAVVAPHGRAVYAMGMYRHGTPGHREQVVATALAGAAGLAAEEAATVCGARHAEDIEVHDLPHTARRSARRAMRDAARMHGGTWQLVRTWQHYGACPDESRAPGPGDVPLFDAPGGVGDGRQGPVT